MIQNEGWPPEDIKAALAELRLRHPNLSAGMFRVLLRTAMQQVNPPDLQGLIDCADKIIRALAEDL